MYALAQKNGHVVWKEQWYTFTSRASLRVNLYMICEDQVFIATVVVIDSTRKIVALGVISQSTNIVAKLNAIAKIHKYRRFHEGHHFILMAMEVHGKLGCDMGCFIRECVRLFKDRQLGGHLFYFLHLIF